MRFGVVGAGNMGAIYAHCLKNLVQGASLGGVTGGTRAPALANTHGVAFVPTLEELLARDDIDAVALTSPTQAHLSQTLAVAAAGKHVFVEKPMAVTVEDCDAMIQACRAAGVELAVNSVTRYRRGVRQAKELVDQGAIGSIRMIRHTYSWILTDYSGGKSWTLEPGAGSPFLDQGAHCNDVLRWFTGSEPALCLAQYASYGSAPPPNQSAMVTYRFENGVMADLWASYEFPRPGLGKRGWTIDYMFVGSEGIIDVEYYGSLRLGRGDRWETLYEHPVVDLIRDPLDPNRMYPYADQLQDFVDAIAVGRRPLVTGEDGRAGIEMAVAADLAAATNQAVQLPLSSEGWRALRSRGDREERVQAIRVRDIDAGGFEQYGEVLAPRDADGRAELVAEWTAFARERYGSEVAPQELSIPAKPPLLNFVEAHPNSPQLTVSFEQPWFLSVLPKWSGLESFDPAAVETFIVHPNVGVLIPAGLWHGSVTPLEATDVLVVFKAGVVDEWTELPNPVPLILERTTV